MRKPPTRDIDEGACRPYRAKRVQVQLRRLSTTTTREDAMTMDSIVPPGTRRDFIREVGTSAGAAAVLGGVGLDPCVSGAMAAEMGRSETPLKAAFSNAGLQATWCAQGKQAAEFWGKLFNVEVTWFDGELGATKQRAAIDNMASQKW